VLASRRGASTSPEQAGQPFLSGEENTHPGKVHFALEDGDFRPGRWNTLRALRVLGWREQSATCRTLR